MRVPSFRAFLQRNQALADDIRHFQAAALLEQVARLVEQIAAADRRDLRRYHHGFRAADAGFDNAVQAFVV